MWIFFKLFLCVIKRGGTQRGRFPLRHNRNAICKYFEGYFAQKVWECAFGKFVTNKIG